MKDQNPKIKEFLNVISQKKFNTTVDTSTDSGICADCKQPALPNCYSPAGIKEFYISGLCEKCFDKLFSEDKDGEISDYEVPAF